MPPAVVPTPLHRHSSGRSRRSGRLAWLTRMGCLIAALAGCGSDEAPEPEADGAASMPADDAASEARDASAEPAADAGSEPSQEEAGQADARVASDGSTRSDAGSSDASSGSDASGSDASSSDAATPPSDAGSVAARPSCKRGVSYNNEQAGDAKAFGSNITWWYDWGANPSAAARSALEAAGVEFVPMVWSGPPRRNIDVQALIRDIPKSAKYLLGFNEPNFGAQANLTPEQAAAAWPQLEEIARARNLKLVSPAPNYCGGDCNRTDPFVWLDDFFAACKDCQVDYVAFHWYACSIEALKSITAKYESRYKRPVWLTEFACLDDPGDHSTAGQRAYMDKAVAFLESDPQVFRYSWFIGRSSQPGAIDLFAAPGVLTPLGSAYAGYQGTCR